MTLSATRCCALRHAFCYPHRLCSRARGFFLFTDIIGHASCCELNRLRSWRARVRRLRDSVASLKLSFLICFVITEGFLATSLAVISQYASPVEINPRAIVKLSARRRWYVFVFSYIIIIEIIPWIASVIFAFSLLYPLCIYLVDI